MIPAAAMPYKTALVYTYDCGDFGKNLEDCLKLADYAGFAKRRAKSEKRGKLRGLGIASTVEASNAGLIEHAELRFDPTGTITVLVGTHDHGQGHQTTFRQIIADKLGVDPSRIAFKFGDTDQIMIGTGTFGSRSTACAGTAMLMAADKIIAKGTKIAAHMLEAGEHDIVVQGRQVRGRRHRQGGRPRPGRARRLRAGQAAEGRRARPLRDRHLRRRPAHLSRTAATSARSRSTRRPARSRWCATPRSTTSAT